MLDVRNIIEQYYSLKALKHTLLTNKVKKKRHLKKVKMYSLVQTIEGTLSNYDSESDTGSVKDSRDDISVILKQHGKALPSSNVLINSDKDSSDFTDIRGRHQEQF